MQLSVERICLKKPRGVAFEEGEAWKRNRRILAPTFSATKMKIVRKQTNEKRSSVFITLHNIEYLILHYCR